MKPDSTLPAIEMRHFCQQRHRLKCGFAMLGRVLSLCGLWWFSVAPTSAADIYEYAREVCEQLGPFPSFNVFDPSLSHEIPMTQNGVPLTGETTSSTSLCDRPPLLDGRVVPYSRIGRLPGFEPDTFLPTTDVLWTFLARRHTIRASADHALFEDIAIIGHNRRSGATAFFQAGVFESVDGTRIPSPMGFRRLPNEPAVDSFWLSPRTTASARCYRCHDNGPFIHSPFVDQVRAKGELVVPLVDRKPPGPYWFVGSEFATWPTPKYMNRPGNLCTSCHVIGNGRDAANLILYFTGRQFPNQVTEAFKQYPLSHYMPNVSLTDGFPTQESWEAAYGQSVDELLACKMDPDDPLCWTPFSRVAVDPGPAGAVYVDASSLLPVEQGTRQFPFKSLGMGYSAVSQGNTLVVKAGTYSATCLDKPMTIARQDPKTPGQVTIRSNPAVALAPATP